MSLLSPEIIGPPECPILKRWTLIPWREPKDDRAEARFKLMVHHFLPNADDRDLHDHPRPFWTLVLRGFYDDIKPCDWCKSTGNMYHDVEGERQTDGYCLGCGSTGMVLRERMGPGKLRFRPASHVHRTKVGPSGCWTLVLMGPLQRRWGFWHLGEWWYWKDHERVFGFGMRCDDNG